MGDQIQTAKIRKFRAKLLAWYDHSGRPLPWRKAGEPEFRLIVTELLLQRTRAPTVARYYSKFFHKYSCWQDIANTEDTVLQNDLKPLGIWKQRSERLKGLASAIVDNGGQLPEDRDQLESLPGMGQYMVNATLLLKGKQDAPLLDANMARVFERCFGPRKLADIRYDASLQNLAWQCVRGAKSKEVNWAILDLAASNCRIRNPICLSCPVHSVCRAFMRESARSSSREQARAGLRSA